MKDRVLMFLYAEKKKFKKNKKIKRLWSNLNRGIYSGREIQAAILGEKNLALLN